MDLQPKKKKLRRQEGYELDPFSLNAPSTSCETSAHFVLGEHGVGRPVGPTECVQFGNVLTMEDMLRIDKYNRIYDRSSRRFTYPDGRHGKELKKQFKHRPKKQRKRDKMAEAIEMVNMSAGPEGSKPSHPSMTGDPPPRRLYVQLNELKPTEDGSFKWHQVARWIKYEEDWQGSRRWSAPHVSSLSYQTLSSVRKCINDAYTVFGLDETLLPTIINTVVKDMKMTKKISENDKNILLRYLILDHRSLERGRRKTFDIGTQWQGLRKNSSEETDAEYILPQESPQRKCSSQISISCLKQGTEACICLVGVVTELQKPAVAFIRLKKSVFMEELTQAYVPIRFMFFILGPKTPTMDYHDIGRTMATLMSNSQFGFIAYRAMERRELIDAIDLFLEDSIVLPPGEWDDREVLSIAEIRANAEMIRRRREELIMLGDTFSEDVPRLNRFDVEENPNGNSYRDTDRTNPLTRTHVPFGGVIRDIKQRFQWYKSDFYDAMNLRCLTAIIYLVLATITSNITFGGLLEDKTNGAIGITETLIFSSLAGIIFALTSGQPLMIVGITGPLLLLDEGLSNFCLLNNYDFFVVRMYCGFWMFIIAVMVAAFDGSAAVKCVTRFTEDIFTFLIGLVFITEPMIALYNIYRAHPISQDEQNNFSFAQPLIDYVNNTNANYTNSDFNQNQSIVQDELLFQDNSTAMTINETPIANGTGNSPLLAFLKFFVTEKDVGIESQPNTALFSVLLTLGTFILSHLLEVFRKSRYFCLNCRNGIGNVGVPMAVMIVTTITHMLPVYVDTVEIPSSVHPLKNRYWIIPFNEREKHVPSWIVWASIVPAFMLYTVIFFETLIAELIVDKPIRKLKKGSGFHMDILIISLINVFCGFFGAPWQCVATIRSLSHVQVLTVMTRDNPPGEEPKVNFVMEQRVTALVVSILMGLTVFISDWLKLIPMSVLLGVFLYMSEAAFHNNQFWIRFKMLFKFTENYPSEPRFVRDVPPKKIHLFTMLQFSAIALLFIIQSSEISLVLPFFVLLCIPYRYLISPLFTKDEMNALDEINLEDDESTMPGL